MLVSQENDMKYGVTIDLLHDRPHVAAIRNDRESAEALAERMQENGMRNPTVVELPTEQHVFGATIQMDRLEDWARG
jgi:hypothetical protein